MKLKEAKKKYEGNWIAFLIKSNGDNPEGEVLDYDKDKSALQERLRQKNVKEAYITYAGSYIKAGYEVMF